jgi:hypothetical protein
MHSHAENYGLIAPFRKVALFGANGQIGDRILHALVTCKRPGHTFQVVAFIPPGSDLQQKSNSITVKTFDAEKASHDVLAKELSGIEVVVSALNGPALKAQTTIQDAAVTAGVKRIYPSEYGFHHTFRKPNDPMGYIHPAWNLKAEYVILNWVKHDRD